MALFVAVGSGLVVVITSAGFTVRLTGSCAWALFASVALMVTEYGLDVSVPAAGVPLMTPLLLMFNPLGNPVAVTLTVGAPPAMVNVPPLLKPHPTVATANGLFCVIVGAAKTVRL